MEHGILIIVLLMAILQTSVVLPAPQTSNGKCIFSNEHASWIKNIRIIQIFLLSNTRPIFLTTGLCTSWNGNACTGSDTVDVGRGAGSCNSNTDCPCCAPFCSTSGYCQKSDTQQYTGKVLILTAT